MSRKPHVYTGIKRTGIVITFLLLSALAYSQDDAPVDTLRSYTGADTAVTEVEVEPAPGEEAGTQTNYFEEKWMPGSGPDSLHLRRLNDTLLTRMQQDEDFWYANAAFEKQQKTAKKRNSSDSGSSGAFETILWLFIIGGFIAFLVIYLSNSNIRLFRRSRSIPQEEPDAETGDIFTIPYQKEIDKAISAGNYRLAIRLLYLRLLLHLSEKHVIQYTPDKTNFDYLLQLQQTSWYQPFFRLTRHYEYVWYGWFDIDREKFDMINAEFTRLEQQL